MSGRRPIGSWVLIALWWVTLAWLIGLLAAGANADMPEPVIGLYVLIGLFSGHANWPVWVARAALVLVTAALLFDARRNRCVSWRAGGAWLLRFSLLFGGAFAVAWSGLPHWACFELSRSSFDTLMEEGPTESPASQEVGLFRVDESWVNDDGIVFFEVRVPFIRIPSTAYWVGFARQPDEHPAPWPDRVIRHHDLGGGWYRVVMDLNP